MTKVVIIGAGIGGLATANLLAAGGYQVDVYEKQAQPGGRAGQYKADGFTFDTGPSWYLMPEVFKHYFHLLGEDVNALLDLRRLDPAYKVFFESYPQPMTVHGDLAKDRRQFDGIEPGAGNKLAAYLERSADMYKAATESFLYTNFQNKTGLLRETSPSLWPRLASAAVTPIDRYVGRYFKDYRLKQIMEYPMVFLGTSPYDAPSLYSLMSHMDFTQGVYYPQGGLYEIIKSLEKIGRRHGVSYHYGQEITAIRSNGHHAAGVTLANGLEVNADIVISNADLHFTETQLLTVESRSYDEEYWQRKQAGPSALLLYLGVRGELPELQHHNLLFTADWKKNFSAIFETKNWPEPASIYICKPSQTDPGVAPAGHENLFVLVPAPARPDTSEAELERLAEGYLNQIEQMTGIADLQQRIVTKKLVGPADFANDFNSWQGTALGMSHRLSQSALFRPANRSKRIGNLYYVGGNTVPGIGLPMCLIGAELIYKRLSGDRTNRPLQTLPELPDV